MWGIKGVRPEPDSSRRLLASHSALQAAQEQAVLVL
jgi:hypothetical protein